MSLGVNVGDIVVWHRHDRYGGLVEMEVINTTMTTFRAHAKKEGWSFRFRKSDGRVIGNPHNMFSVRLKTDGSTCCAPTVSNQEK